MHRAFNAVRHTWSVPAAASCLLGAVTTRCDEITDDVEHYPYVIIGAGTTAHAAIEAITFRDARSRILVVSDSQSLIEPDLQNGPGLRSNDLLQTYNEWRRHISARLEAEPPEGDGEEGTRGPQTLVKLVVGKGDITIDASQSRLVFSDGRTVGFGRCLIATAGQSRQFYNVDRDRIAYATLADRLNTCVDLSDFEQLDLLPYLSPNARTVVVGGGFLGTEVSLALAAHGLRVSQVYAEPAPLSRELPPYLCEEIKARMLIMAGVQSLPERLVTSFEPLYPADQQCSDADDQTSGAGGAESDDMTDDDTEDDPAMRLTLVGQRKENLDCDYAVLASTHVDPALSLINTRLSGLEVDPVNGAVVVNAQLEALRNVFAAGTAASYYDPSLGRRWVCSLDHSVNSGLAAGFNMTREKAQDKTASSSTSILPPSLAAQGKSDSAELYTHQPVFRSSMPMIDVTCEGVGEVNAKYRTVGFWTKASPVAGPDTQANTPSIQHDNGGYVSTATSQKQPPPHTHDMKANLRSRITKPFERGEPDNSSAFLNDVGPGVKSSAPGLVGRGYQRGVVYYLDDQSRIIGIVLWNATDLVERARELIRRQALELQVDTSTKALKRKIPLAPDSWLTVRETPAKLNPGMRP